MKNEQLKIGDTEEKFFSCAFSGHRELEENFDGKKLELAVRERMEKGAEFFYCGMAKGFDLLAAECVLNLKKEYPKAKLIACIPFFGQEKNFSAEDKKRYVKILSLCTEKVILSEEYYRGCMHNRNRYMAEKADCLIAYCKRDEGGTAYTVKCFEKRKKTVFYL